jgi:hypothetical protein
VIEKSLCEFSFGDKFWLQGYLGNVFAVKQNSMALFEVVETMLQIINDVVWNGY